MRSRFIKLRGFGMLEQAIHFGAGMTRAKGWMRTFLILVSLCSTAPLLLAAPGQKATTRPNPSGKLVVELYADTPIPDPHKTRQFTSHIVMKHVMENLVNYDEAFNIVLQLAEKWSMSTDGKK